MTGYDYRAGGAYFVTICTQGRVPAFARIDDVGVHLHPFGRLVEQHWLELPSRFPWFELDAFAVMPDHIHGIIVSTRPGFDDVHSPGKMESGSLSALMVSYKANATRASNKSRGCRTRVWQRGFYEHIIRNEPELDSIRQYIAENSANWLAKSNHPADAR